MAHAAGLATDPHRFDVHGSRRAGPGGRGRNAGAPPRWYQHDHAKWERFRKRYFAELDANPDGMAELRDHLGRGKVTLLFASKETELNNATALREYLELDE